MIELDIIDAYSDEPTGRLALVFELMDMNLYDAIKGKYKCSSLKFFPNQDDGTTCLRLELSITCSNYLRPLIICIGMESFTEISNRKEIA